MPEAKRAEIQALLAQSPHYVHSPPPRRSINAEIDNESYVLRVGQFTDGEPFFQVNVPAARRLSQTVKDDREHQREHRLRSPGCWQGSDALSIQARHGLVTTHLR